MAYFGYPIQNKIDAQCDDLVNMIQKAVDSNFCVSSPEMYDYWNLSISFWILSVSMAMEITYL